MKTSIKVALAAPVLAGLVGGLGLGTILNSAPANATPMYAVCGGISEALNNGEGYRGYLIDAYNMGRDYHVDMRQQVANIVDSINAYCPQYAPGIRAAAASMSTPRYNDGDGVA